MTFLKFSIRLGRRAQLGTTGGKPIAMVSWEQVEVAWEAATQSAAAE
jgi:hypothetical protein